jgi:hypothetical protein
VKQYLARFLELHGVQLREAWADYKWLTNKYPTQEAISYLIGFCKDKAK